MESKMFSLRNILIFFAGFEFFHTISHIAMPFLVSFPLDLKFMLLTSTMNNWAIVINGIITIALLWWASRLSK